MHTEIEAKFLDVDHDTMRGRLRDMGATCVMTERVMRRCNYDFPDKRLAREQHGWVRVRDEGDKVTLSYKQNDDESLLGTQEINVEVDSFDEMTAFLERIGMTKKTDQETTRESWRLGNIQIELDHWPWTKPFLEIEALSEEDVRQTAKALGLDWAAALHGSVSTVYQAEYDIEPSVVNNDVTVMRFDMPIPAVLAEKQRTT